MRPSIYDYSTKKYECKYKIENIYIIFTVNSAFFAYFFKKAFIYASSPSLHAATASVYPSLSVMMFRASKRAFGVMPVGRLK